ncbi:hypothetical protein [Streptomyces hydrogenans]
MDTPQQPQRTAGQTAADAVAADLIAAVEAAVAPAVPTRPAGPSATPATPPEPLAAPAPLATSYRDPAPVPAVGDALPVAQPGRPPMSAGATDASVVMLAAGGGVLMAGGGVGFALWALAGVDPLTLAVAAGAPVAILAALSRLVRRAGQAAQQAAPVTHHHTYTGPITQTHHTATTTTARGMFARTITKNGR